MKYLYLILFLLITSMAFSQREDSISHRLKIDTLINWPIRKGDSISNAFQVKADSFHILYEKRIGRIDSIKNLLASKIDSLRQINLPAEKLLKQYDSLEQSMKQWVSGLTTEFEQLKSRTVHELQRIHLPQPMQESVQKLEGIVTGFSLPTGNFSLSSLNRTEWLRLGNMDGNALSNKLDIQSDLKGVTESFNKVSGEVSEVGQYTQGARSFGSGHMMDIENMDKVLEEKVQELDGVNQLSEQSALLDQAKSLDSAQMTEKINSMVKEHVVKAAKDHFEGKQEVLQEAMNNMNKLKKKYDDVQNMAELPKKLPNPLKGKPFVERLVPGITFQVQKSNKLWIDFNPMLMYRVSPMISAGVGWNQRLIWDNSCTLLKAETVYGPRAALEVKWKKGINFRLLPEIMNTTLPGMVAHAKGVDAAYREWVGSLFVGVRKDFAVYKQINGNTEVLYNLFDPDGLSPYGDRLSLRFGFEFPMVKKGR